MLLSGPPGTGKTFTAEGIAGTLGREIIEVDATDYLTKWYGMTEQNLSELFFAYRDICEQDEKAPVLIIHEADQIFGQRQSCGSQASDITEHRLQSLLLAHLERLSGILIGTTNHVSSIDDAYSRRFDVKLEFPLPNAEQRLALWEAHIPATVPLASDVNLVEMANKYALSGGQIAIVASNAITSAVLRGDHLTQADILRASQVELKGSFDQSRGCPVFSGDCA
jgi:SpoVK/Ycf46/Vps4 family AAA+-type ATPase